MSPFSRTVETAHFTFEKYRKVEVIIDNRLMEIILLDLENVEKINMISKIDCVNF